MGHSAFMRQLAVLRQIYPAPTCALHFDTPFQLLIATILSAQCTDVRVNQVTKKLFARYPTPKTMAKAPLATLEQLIHATGFYRAKATYLQGSALILMEQYQGQVPTTMEQLLELPGVARKTANVVLGVGFGIAAGIVVDTHVKRLSNRLGWTKATSPVHIEQALCQWVPKQDWISLSHRLIEHGRAICQARSPSCQHCPLRQLCPTAKQHAASSA